MNETIVEVLIGNDKFFVELSDFEEERKYVSNFIERSNKEDETFYHIWELNKSTVKEVESDVSEMINMLDLIETDPLILSKYVNDVRKKKNGLFWKNSGTVIARMEHCTGYFTDFTNAWSTPELRLDVINENTCKLSIRERTYTH